MITQPLFTLSQAEQLRHFLAAPERPAGTLSYAELAGFLFAICCSPEMVSPSNWLPLVFGDKDAGYQNLEQAQQILATIMALYNHINEGVQNKQPALPPQCEARRAIPSNLEPDAPISQWARGFGMGHDYLSELWDAYTPEDLNEDMGACMMVLTFFASRDLAQAYQEQIQATDKPLEELAAHMLEIFPEALHRYALLGLSIADILQRRQAPEPARSIKIGRNDPCPCGSGKKYKHCCGATVH